MDRKTQNSFCSGNSQEILNLHNPNQSDCPLCLWILEQEAKELGFWNPNIISILILLSYWETSPPKKHKSFTLTFLNPHFLPTVKLSSKTKVFL